jgi:hypothetical protein
MTDTQRSIIQPTGTDLLLGSIVRESNLGGSDRKLPQRRMNTWGEINNRCVVGNSADRNRKLADRRAVQGVRPVMGRFEPQVRTKKHTALVD